MQKFYRIIAREASTTATLSGASLQISANEKVETMPWDYSWKEAVCLDDRWRFHLFPAALTADNVCADRRGVRATTLSLSWWIRPASKLLNDNGSAASQPVPHGGPATSHDAATRRNHRDPHTCTTTDPDGKRQDVRTDISSSTTYSLTAADW